MTIQSCKNCAYFRQHYAKDDDGQLYEVAAGHCTNVKIHIMQFRRCFKTEDACNYWLETEDVQPQENINDVIKQAAANIELLVKHFGLDKSK